MVAKIFKFAWRNIWRNKRRTFFTLLAIAVGLIAVIFAKSYIAGIINTTHEAIIKTQLGHVKIAHREFLRLERIMPKESLVTGLARLRREVVDIGGVQTIDPRIRFNVMLSHGDINERGMAVGVEPAAVDRSMEISTLIREGRYFDENGSGVLLGRKLAKKLTAEVGDEVLLVTSDINYSTYALPFKVAGIFETGYPAIDKFTLYMPLSKAQEMLDCGDAAHEVLLFLDEPARAQAVAAKMKENLSQWESGEELQVITWQESDIVKNLMPVINNIYDKILWIVMLIVALVILNTMLMAVMERYHEIGIIKAMGLKNLEVFFMILVEAFYIGIIGSLIGGALGGAISAAVERSGIDIVAMMGEGVWEKLDIPLPMFGQVLYPDFSLAILFSSIIFGIFIALLAVLYPAYKSARMLPVEAFRSELKL
jgi:putative ABC transport system permease protein